MDYLIKPVDLDELRGVVERGLRRRVMTQAVKEAATETAKVAGIFEQLGRSIHQNGRHSEHLEWSTQEYMAQALGHLAHLSGLIGRTLEASRASHLRSPWVSVRS